MQPNEEDDKTAHVQLAAYAKQHCRPPLSAEAKGILQEFYVELREKAQAVAGSPIAWRCAARPSSAAFAAA